MMRHTPMKRTAFKRPLFGSFKAAPARAPIEPKRRKQQSKYSTIVKKARKPKAGDEKRMREACRGQRCFLRVPFVCNNRRETVVPCHTNESALGKGAGLKAPDRFTVPGCSACHAWLDQGPSPRLLKFGVWRRGYSEWSIERDGEEDLNVPAL